MSILKNAMLLFTAPQLINTPLAAQANDEVFWWGVGHAAFQVEGSPANSDWKEWTENSKNIKDGSNANKGTNFWNTPEADFALAEKLGAKMFRLSIAWERIEPSPGQYDEAAMAHYEKIILTLRKYKLEPLVTLYHFTTPGWLAQEGGLTSPRFAESFSKYAQFVIRRLSLGPTQVRWWMTFNEPFVPVLAGYIIGIWPPGKKNLFTAIQVANTLIDTQNRTMSLIRQDKTLPQNLKLSVAYHWRDIQAEGFGIFNSTVRRVTNWIVNVWYLNAISASTQLDYLGVNYYGRYVLHFKWQWPFISVDEGEGVKSDLGWVVHPEGLKNTLKETYERYKLPILISENGIADAQDTRRAEFIKNHIAEIKTARKNNIPVIGYLHWSLTDNFEWAEGLMPRFGLVEMDYEKMERKPRPSFKVYQEIIKTGI
jgi:beta-glucosidase